MTYYNLTGWMNESYKEEWKLENLYMETQGNWQAFKNQYFGSINAYYN